MVSDRHTYRGVRKMFINSKIRVLVRNGKDSFIIPKDYIGEVPQWVAESWIVRKAIESGHIATPSNKSDKALEDADKDAEIKHEEAEAEAKEQAEAEAEGTEPKPKKTTSKKK
jgi:hypothetical protein